MNSRQRRISKRGTTIKRRAFLRGCERDNGRRPDRVFEGGEIFFQNDQTGETIHLGRAPFMGIYDDPSDPPAVETATLAHPTKMERARALIAGYRQTHPGDPASVESIADWADAEGIWPIPDERFDGVTKCHVWETRLEMAISEKAAP